MSASRVLPKQQWNGLGRVTRLEKPFGSGGKVEGVPLLFNLQFHTIAMHRGLRENSPATGAETASAVLLAPQPITTQLHLRTADPD